MRVRRSNGLIRRSADFARAVRAALSASIVTAICVGAPPAFSQCLLSRLEPVSVEDALAFGWSVAGDDDRAIVGAYYSAGNVPGSGAAHILRRQGIHWSHEAFLPGESYGDYFGSAVAIDGDRALVGATDVDHGTSTGSVYVYERRDGSWVMASRIDPAPGESLLQFGYAVTLVDDVAVMSAYADDHENFAGSVFVYRYDGSRWAREAQLISADAPRAAFGRSLAFDGARALVGVRLDFENENGAAFLFERSAEGSWRQTAHFAQPPLDNIGFGYSVGLDGDFAAIGAYKDHFTGHHHGAIYIYRRSATGGWLQEAYVGASDGQSYDYFGSGLAIKGGRMLVGAPGKDGSRTTDCGGAYLFQRNDDGDWIETGSLNVARPVEAEALGYSVALVAGQALATAVGAEVQELAVGAVYCFAVDQADCNNNREPDLCDIAGGTSADNNQDAIPDECQMPLCLPDCAPPANGVVDVDDLLFLIANWGVAGAWGPADIAPAGGDGAVDVSDLLALISAWGPCPR